GKPPFKGPTGVETLLQVLNDDPVPPARLNRACPRDLETVCLKCLRKRPADRYPTAHRLAEDLRRFLEGRPVEARPAGPPERLAKWVRRSPYQAAALAAGVAFVLALGAALVSRVQSVQKDADLLRQRQELTERELAEGRRREDVTGRFTALFSGAENRASEA